MSQIPKFFIACIKCVEETHQGGEVNMQVDPIARGVTLLRYKCFVCNTEAEQLLDARTNPHDITPTTREEFKESIRTGVHEA